MVEIGFHSNRCAANMEVEKKQLQKKQPLVGKEHCKAQRSDSIVLSYFVFTMFCSTCA